MLYNIVSNWQNVYIGGNPQLSAWMALLNKLKKQVFVHKDSSQVSSSEHFYRVSKIVSIALLLALHVIAFVWLYDQRKFRGHGDE